MKPNYLSNCVEKAEIINLLCKGRSDYDCTDDGVATPNVFFSRCGMLVQMGYDLENTSAVFETLSSRQHTTN